MDHQGLLDSCAKLLDQHAVVLRVAEATHVGVAGTVPELLRMSLEFGVKSLESVKLLMDRRMSVQAACVTRPLYETSVQMLWASRAPQGWDQLVVYFAKEDKKWAEPIIRDTPQSTWRQFADSVVQDADAALSRVGDVKAPSVCHMVSQIACLDRAEGLGPASAEYARVYRFLCMSVHGHVNAVCGEWNRLIGTHAVRYGCVNATLCLARAAICVVASDKETRMHRTNVLIGEVRSALATYG